MRKPFPQLIRVSLVSGKRQEGMRWIDGDQEDDRAAR